MNDPDLLVGADHFSDAGVYRLAPKIALVQSLDFFPPLVDDPYTFGRIAAANALSDVYAMGAQPKTVMNIVGFPDKELDMSILAEILRGGAERTVEAGAVVVGGHSVRDAEIKFGLSVTGIVDPAKMMRNDAARPGDALVLTKPLGTGLITTAARGGRCPDDVLAAACDSMIELNKAACQAAIAAGVSAATDITGFGLAGHARELAEASGVTIQISLSDLPLLQGVESLIDRKNFSGANEKNQEALRSAIQIADDVNQSILPIIYDPQTSGGLLIAIPDHRLESLMERCAYSGVENATVVGRVCEREGKTAIVIVS